MKKFCVIILAIFLLMSVSSAVFAADMPVKPAPARSTSTPALAKTTSQTQSTSSGYPPGPIQKAERGFMNAAYGWTEIPKRIVDKTKEYNNPIKGFLVGAFQGSCKAFARTASGVSELATFPIGRYDKPAVLPDMPAAK